LIENGRTQTKIYLEKRVELSLWKFQLTKLSKDFQTIKRKEDQEIGLVCATVTEAFIYFSELVNIVGCTVLYLKRYLSVATVINLVNAEFSCDCAVTHCRMISSQPGSEV